MTTKHLSRLKVAAVILTAFGLILFTFLVYTIGFHDIYEGITRFGIVGFAGILSIYFVRICARAFAWKLAVMEPYRLSIKDTVPAVIIGEAMSSTIPLGILISGTAKAVAVRNRMPLVAGLSSVATENLFYSFVTGFFLIGGATTLLRGFAVDDGLRWTLDGLVALLVILLALGVVMVVRQWHFASSICMWLYKKGFMRHLLENGRASVRTFEDLIYGFYRQHPKRFLPICLCECLYHICGVGEVYLILSRLSEVYPSLMQAFLLESVSRLVTVVFKLVPFMIGVDEAGAQFVGQSIALAAGVGVTLAIIRKGRMLFWTAMGFLIMIKRELSFGDLTDSTPL